MATKAKALAALRKISPQASIEDDSADNEWCVYLIAPDGHHWSDASIHSREVSMFAAPSEKHRFWDMVIDEISCLGTPEACCKDTCGEWVAEQSSNFCGYWS